MQPNLSQQNQSVSISSNFAYGSVSSVLSFIVIGHYTISIPEIFQPFTVFWLGQ